jgi:hypothetical protein
MDIDDIHERMNVVAPFHDRYDGVDEYGSLVADDVAAKNFVVGRNEQFTQAMFFFQRAAFGGLHEGDRRCNIGRTALLQLFSVAPTPATSGEVKIACGIGP